MSRQRTVRTGSVSGQFQHLAEQHPALLSAELFHHEDSAAPQRHRTPPLLALLLRILSLMPWV